MRPLSYPDISLLPVLTLTASLVSGLRSTGQPGSSSKDGSIPAYQHVSVHAHASNPSVEFSPSGSELLNTRQSTQSNGSTSGSYTVLSTFQDEDGESWTVEQDLTQPNGSLIFTSAGGMQKTLPGYLESTLDPTSPSVPLYLGYDIATVGLALNDLLADGLLANGEPNEDHVRDVVPISYSPNWDAIVGTVEANDTMYIDYWGDSINYCPLCGGNISDWYTYTNNTLDGVVGGWMPGVRKVFRSADLGDWFEVTAFGDVDKKSPLIIDIWFRTMHVSNGQVSRVWYAQNYKTFLPARTTPAPAAYYKALLRFCDYWEEKLEEMSVLELPDSSWVDYTKHALAKELVVRYAGFYPKYGAYDRYYAGSEYDGFQDVFTSSLSANLEFGRFTQASKVIDNYFTWFVSSTGDIDMRGPETGQFGLTLSLLAKYAQYTGDTALLMKYKDKIVATANVLTVRHDESLQLDESDPGYGLIAGWSESDSCLQGSHSTAYEKPYYSNSAFAARGLKDIATLGIFDQSASWKTRAETLKNRTAESLSQWIKRDMNPPYVPILPDRNLTVRESLATESYSEQAWPHRVYAELLHASILPKDLANETVNSMRAYGITSLGIVANVGTPANDTRDILGFISYGYALNLLYLDRIDDFILFLYAHRYHVHNRGQWISSEVAGTGGGNGAFCMPAQLATPPIVRWMLVLEHPDDDLLYVGKGVPRAWLGTGKEISIKQAPTRWGRVDFSLQVSKTNKLSSTIVFSDQVPQEVQLKLRLPEGTTLGNITVNGRAATLDSNEDLIVKLKAGEKKAVIVGY